MTPVPRRARHCAVPPVATTRDSCTLCAPPDPPAEAAEVRRTAVAVGQRRRETSTVLWRGGAPADRANVRGQTVVARVAGAGVAARFDLADDARQGGR